MSSPSGNSKRRNRNRRRSTGLSYDNLEARRVLATIVSFDAGSGLLSIEMTENNDVALVDISNDGNISVNGDEDVDTVRSNCRVHCASKHFC